MLPSRIFLTCRQSGFRGSVLKRCIKYSSNRFLHPESSLSLIPWVTFRFVFLASDTFPKVEPGELLPLMHCREQANRKNTPRRMLQQLNCLSYFHQKYSSLQKKFRSLWQYFGHFSCISFVCMTCKASSRSAYNLKSVVEMFPSFVKLVSCFRKCINQHFWWGLLLLWSCTSALSSLVAWLW